MAIPSGVVTESGHALAQANGHAKANGTVEKSKRTEEDIYEEENIFVFIPNIIGMDFAHWIPLTPIATLALCGS